jgi:hypothetical protein
MSARTAGGSWSLDRLLSIRSTEVRPGGKAGELDAVVAAQGKVKGLRRAEIVLGRARQIGRVAVAGTWSASSKLRDVFAQMEKVGADLLNLDAKAGLGSFADAGNGAGRATGVVLGDADSRAAAETALAAGATYLALPPRRLIAGHDAHADYVDRLIGFFEDNGIRIVRGIAAAPAAVSPAAGIAVALAEAQLALDQGVRSVALQAGMRGSLVEDVAALNVLRSLANRWLGRAGSDFFVHVGAAGITVPAEIDRGHALSLNNSLAAALGRADFYDARPSHAQAGDLKALLDGVQSARQMLDLSAGQWLEESPALAQAGQALEREALAILGAGSGADLDVAAAAARLRAAKAEPIPVEALFRPLPRNTPRGLVTSPLGPWSENKVGIAPQ